MAADKVTIEAKSPHAGTIKAIHVEVGQTVEVGGKFFAIAVGVGDAAAAAAAPTAAAPATAVVAHCRVCRGQRTAPHRHRRTTPTAQIRASTAGASRRHFDRNVA